MGFVPLMLEQSQMANQALEGSAQYPHDEDLSPSTEDGHDCTTGSNVRRMDQLWGSPHLRGAQDQSVLQSSFGHHWTSDLKDFSNTDPFHRSKDVCSGDLQLSPSIATRVWRHLSSSFPKNSEVYSFPLSRKLSNAYMAPWRASAPFDMASQSDVGRIPRGAKAEMGMMG